MEDLLCQGCGAPIQTNEPKKLGYTPSSALKKEVVMCQRCFRLKHYNEIQSVGVTDDDFMEMVSTIGANDGLVVHLVDIFDVSGSLVKSLPRIIGDNPVILVGNKLDLLPKSTNRRKLIQWLRGMAKENGIKVQDVFLISSMKRHGFDELKDAIEHDRDGRNVYVVGTTNVGKSTFINQLIKESTGIGEVITTSYFPGTTLGFIEIPLDEQSALIDTPGLVNKKQIAHYVDAADLKLITPAKEVKPRIYQLNTGQTLFFGGLARLDFEKGTKQSFVCYFSNRLPIHRTKLENADQLYDDHKGEMLLPPNMETLRELPPLTSKSIHVKQAETDIVFPGLGWVSVQNANTTIHAHSPKGVEVTIRKSLI